MTLLTQKECADVLRLSERTLERYRCSGTGPRFIKCGRSIRYRSQDIETWLRRTQSVPRQKGRLKAAVSPYVAFMDAYWEPDPIGEGTLVKLFEATFRHWCLQTEAFDLAGTSKSNMIQEIKKIPRWTWLKAYRPTGNDRRRRYRVKLKAGAKIPDEVLRGDYYDD